MELGVLGHTFTTGGTNAERFLEQVEPVKVQKNDHKSHEVMAIFILYIRLRVGVCIRYLKVKRPG